MSQIRVRGFKDGNLVFEDTLDADSVDLVATAERQIQILTANDHDPLIMVEIEFLDEPDINQRFLRFGSDHSLMRNPVAIDLEALRQSEPKPQT